MAAKYLTKYLTKGELDMIEEIKNKILHADTVKEIELYEQQIGLIMERAAIRKKSDIEPKNA